MNRDTFRAVTTAAFIGLVALLPHDCLAQTMQDAACSDLALQFDPGGVLTTSGAECQQLQSAKGRVETIRARGALSMVVTTLLHMESFDSAITVFRIEDFVSTTHTFADTSDWSEPRSIGGYQVWAFI